MSGDRSEQFMAEVFAVWRLLLLETLDRVNAAGAGVGAAGADAGMGPLEGQRAVRAVVARVGRQLWAAGAAPSGTAGSDAVFAAAGSGGFGSSSASVASSPSLPLAFPLRELAFTVELALAAAQGWPEALHPGYEWGWFAVGTLGEAGVPWQTRYAAYASLVEEAMCVLGRPL